MATSTNATNPSKSAGSFNRSASRGRKVYDHTMSDKEKYALSIVHQATKACRVIAEDIKSGKGASGDSLRACTTLAGAAASSVFASDKPSE